MSQKELMIISYFLFFPGPRTGKMTKSEVDSLVKRRWLHENSTGAYSVLPEAEKIVTRCLESSELLPNSL